MTIDAIACNPTIADAITGNGADFVLAVKENQPSLRGEIAAFFDATPAESLKVHVDIDKDRGRIGSALLGRRAPWGTPSSGRHVNIWVQVSRFRRPMRSGLPCSISPAPAPAWWMFRSPDAACATRRVLDAMRRVPREAFVEPGLRGVRLRGRAAADRRGPDDLAALHRRADDRGGRGPAGRPGARGRRRLRLCRGRAEPDRRPGLCDRAPSRRWARRPGGGSSRLGYDNIELRVGDGTRGWPEAAPFDAILVAAGGPDVPPALKEQLAIGGRLVIPVGDDAAEQRAAEDHAARARREFEEEDLGAVAFVPLIGEQGWAEDGRRSATQPRARASRADEPCRR